MIMSNNITLLQELNIMIFILGIVVGLIIRIISGGNLYTCSQQRQQRQQLKYSQLNLSTHAFISFGIYIICVALEHLLTYNNRGGVNIYGAANATTTAAAAAAAIRTAIIITALLLNLLNGYIVGSFASWLITETALQVFSSTTRRLTNKAVRNDLYNHHPCYYQQKCLLLIQHDDDEEMGIPSILRLCSDDLGIICEEESSNDDESIDYDVDFAEFVAIAAMT